MEKSNQSNQSNQSKKSEVIAAMTEQMQANKREKVSCDQECWVKDRIRDAIRMATALRVNKGVRANEHAYNMALNGIIEGQAIEIIKTLGLEPEYTNLRPEQRFFAPLVGKQSGTLTKIQPMEPGEVSG